MSTDAIRSSTAQTPLSDHVAAEIRADLGRQGISQRQLATKLGVSAPWVSDRLAGKTTISLDDLVVIAAALRRPLSFFLPDSVGEVGPEPEARSQPMRSRPTHARKGRLATHEYGPMANRGGGVAARVGESVTRPSNRAGSRTPRDSRPKGRPADATPAPTLRRAVRIGSASASA